ncbi:MAG: hypothetical protein PWP24_1301 [Clostridiales bacterium]|nr:hypothetical protein [Clostridiales bacterium]
MITISLCMIVRNEENVLERCLNSLSGVVDEIIIVDTGSTDSTKTIARRYTKHVYDFVWQDDFAAARNYSFSKATKEYIYVADADEVIDGENQKRFLQLKQTLLKEIEIVQMLYCNQLAFNTTYNFDEEYRPKLFRRIREFVWENCIHENVRLEPLIYDSEIRIEHRPTSNHGKRDFYIFNQMTDRGEYLSKKLHTMYARELFIAGEDSDFYQAQKYFMEAANDTRRSLEEVKEALCVLVKVARLKDDSKQLLKYAAKELASEPSSELCFELGEYYFLQGDFHEAIIWFYNAAFETTSLLNIRYSKELPLYRLHDCYQRLGNEEQASYYEELARNATTEG